MALRSASATPDARGGNDAENPSRRGGKPAGGAELVANLVPRRPFADGDQLVPVHGHGAPDPIARCGQQRIIGASRVRDVGPTALVSHIAGEIQVGQHGGARRKGEKQVLIVESVAFAVLTQQVKPTVQGPRQVNHAGLPPLCRRIYAGVQPAKDLPRGLPQHSCIRLCAGATLGSVATHAACTDCVGNTTEPHTSRRGNEP
jgi:hypothetical protein